ncbi:hypothetical protein HOLleu_01156 [Holothuria leucospilota]|uniref:Uncharacterized protein n=1 Tax=Holothuria leucospilota TaxID=206669 RepID=A0A9Q1CQ25_HOLLE|nr:hypothetical protein HOLleu_01156 [Holothuria leucospilota]
MLASCSSKSHSIIDFSTEKAINFTDIILLEKSQKAVKTWIFLEQLTFLQLVTHSSCSIYQKAAVLCKFVQRCFFEISPQTGSKSIKDKGGNKNHIQPGVLRLVNKL